ncbi:hypothetical protein [Streptomyces atratus]|uniref:hypothetical protein n=1 Tax=Streptomyces atratus TaxID=1893 RepID=UPI0033FD8212
MSAANLAADLDAWLRILTLHDEADLAEAEPQTMRLRIYHQPARLARPGPRLSSSPGTASPPCHNRLEPHDRIPTRAGPAPTKTRTEDTRTTPETWKPAQPQRHAKTPPDNLGNKRGEPITSPNSNHR